MSHDLSLRRALGLRVDAPTIERYMARRPARLEGRDYCLDSDDGAVACLKYQRGAEFPVSPRGGDSGAAVIYGNDARGVLSATEEFTRGSQNVTLGLYSHIHDVLTGLGLDGGVVTR